MIICSQCGNTVNSNQTFCIECGAQVQQRTTAASVSPTTPYTRAPEPTTPSIEPQAKQPFTPMMWILVPIGVLLVVIVVIAGVKLSSSSKESKTFNSNSQVSAASPVPNYYPAARVVICRFNGVNVRDAPSLTATIVTEIQQGHVVNVLRESSNRDTVMIRSLNREVTDNWSEVQLENTPNGSVHGWIFSGFLR